jgi:hypothetical protein
MKKEYNFEKGIRGKFYRHDAKIKVPIYLSEDNMRFIESIARKRNRDVHAIANMLINNDKALIKTFR